MQNQDWDKDNLERENVEKALNAILSDAKFVAAPQMSAFLRFVVEQTLDGKSDRIKAYTVAIDALGKPSTFDPQNDPSVRVLAKRLRDTLTAYYERTSGHEIIVQLKSGSYVPKFVTPEQHFASLTSTANAVQPTTTVGQQHSPAPTYRAPNPASARPASPPPESRAGTAAFNNNEPYTSLEPLKKKFQSNPFADHPLKKVQQG